MAGETLKIHIEAAHPTPQADNLAGIAIAAALCNDLTSQGHSVNLAIFVDDIEASQRNAGEFWTQATRTLGERMSDELQTSLPVDPTKTRVEFIQESDMITRGIELTDEIKTQVNSGEAEDARLKADQTSLIFGSGKTREYIRLLGYGGHSELPSCEIMDLACYEKKSSNNDAVITVIDQRYKEQQRKVKKLADILGWQAPILVIFVDESGKKVDQFSWMNSSFSSFK